MPSNRPMNYSTEIPADKTVGECQRILGAAGAASAAVHFDAGEPCGLSFALDTPHGRRNFTLPVNIDGAHRVIERMLRENPPHVSRAQLAKLASQQHAANVAWRVAKDWLEANLALVAAGMATLDETMLPYLHVDEGLTLYQAYQAREQAALPPGSGGA